MRLTDENPRTEGKHSICSPQPPDCIAVHLITVLSELSAHWDVPLRLWFHSKFVCTMFAPFFFFFSWEHLKFLLITQTSTCMDTLYKKRAKSRAGSCTELHNAWCMPGADWGKQVLFGTITTSSTWYVYVLHTLFCLQGLSGGNSRFLIRQGHQIRIHRIPGFAFCQPAQLAYSVRTEIKHDIKW